MGDAGGDEGGGGGVKGELDGTVRVRARRQRRARSVLAGRVAALSRFISKSAERALPFFKVLKKAGLVKWTPEAEAALQDLKRYLSSTPILVAPKP